MSDRIAGAPITWGVCEVPGWGHQMPPQRVFAEMAALGLTATESGPRGYLPPDAARARQILARHRLRLVGGFVPAVWHQPGGGAAEAVEAAAAWLAAAGGNVLVLSADSGVAGYDRREELDGEQWQRLLAGLDRTTEIAGDHGLLAVLHPHVGTVVERRPAVERVLEGSRIPLCLDTGHQLIGGIDPLELARQASDRIRHVQLKDVDADLAAQVTTGRRTYTEAVRAGMYRPLGDGDVDVAGVITTLEGAGFGGWYVLEQDVILDAEPPAGQGPVADAGRSMTYLRSMLQG